MKGNQLIGKDNYFLDINDPVAFVAAVIERHLSKREMSNDTREELIQQGLLILSNMRRLYEPGKNGLDPKTSKFSGYAARYLPDKIKDALHRLEGHKLTKDKDDKREWIEPNITSLDYVNEQNESVEDMEVSEHLQVRDSYYSDLKTNLESALDSLWSEEKHNATNVGILLGEGIKTNNKIKEILGLRNKDIERSKDLIVRSERFLTIALQETG
jgi:DNA-directed RNA polymerase specialized sigma subunit